MDNSQVLGEIVALATELNRETDDLNIEILRLEDALGDASIGVPVWLEGVALGKNADTNTAWELGYVRNGADWRITVRKFEIGSPDRFDAEMVPLISASRAIRCQAADHLGTLLLALRHKMRTFAEDIKRARAVVSDLK